MVGEAASRAPERETSRDPAATDNTMPVAARAMPPLMIVREVAELLRTTPKAVYHLVERGRLPGVVRFGKRILVRRADLLRSLAERRGLSPTRSR